MALLEKEIVVSLDHYTLRICYSSLSHLLHKLVIESRTFTYERMFGLVTMPHLAIDPPLKHNNGQEKRDRDESEGKVDIRQEHDGD